MTPGRIWYFVAGVVLVAGVLAARHLVLTRLDEIQTGMQRIVVPGTAELALDQTGTWTIYHEPHGVIDGKLYVSENVDGLRVRVVTLPDNTPIQVSTPKGSETYSLNGKDGVAVLAFEAASPGRYRLTAGYDDGKAAPSTVLAVANGVFGRLFSTIFGAIGLGVGGLAVAMAIIITTAVGRSRARKAAAL